MSYTNQTANYGLPQYTADDKPTYLGDFNKAMLDIDTAIKANENIATASQTLAQNANNTSSEALSTANTASSSATNAGVRADNAYALAESAKSDATQATTDATDAKTIANSANQTATSANATATSAQTTATNANNTATSAQNSVNALQSTVETLNDKDFISLELSSNMSNVGANTKIAFNNADKQLGTELTLSNNNIVIGDNVNSVSVSAIVSISNVSVGYHVLKLMLNDTVVAQSYLSHGTTTGDLQFESLVIPAKLLTVETGDTISLVYTSPAAGSITVNANGLTYLEALKIN